MRFIEFATSSQSGDARLSFWADTIRRFFGNLRTEGFVGTDSLDATLVAYQVGDLKVFRVIAPGHRVWNASVGSDNPVADTYKLVLQVKGTGTIEQAGKSIVLHPGEWSIYDPRLDYAIDNPEAMEVLVILVPRHPLRNFKLREVQCPMTGHPELDSMQSLFSGFLRSLSLQLADLPDSAANTIADTALGLLISTLATRQAGKDLQLGNPDVMRVRVKQYVNNHLDDHDLSIEKIALEMNCSKRCLHRIFEDEGVTLDRFIWDTRLERCRDALASQKDVRSSISRIAFAWGFNSSAHFCRLFKSRLGVSPRQYLAAAVRHL